MEKQKIFLIFSDNFAFWKFGPFTRGIRPGGTPHFERLPPGAILLPDNYEGPGSPAARSPFFPPASQSHPDSPLSARLMSVSLFRVLHRSFLAAQRAKPYGTSR